MRRHYPFHRFLRPGRLLSFELVFIMGGRVAIQAAGAGGLPSSSRHDTSSDGVRDRQPSAPVAGPAAQPQPNTPTWTGPLRVTD